MKKITRKQAEQFLKKKFGKVDNRGYLNGSPYVDYLCVELWFLDFQDYWKRIDTKKYETVYHYFRHEYCTEEISILRLLTAHIFIRDTYK